MFINLLELMVIGITGLYKIKIKVYSYLKNSNGVDVNLKSLSEIIEDETK